MTVMLSLLRSLLATFLTLIFYFVFGLTLVIFHVFQLISYYTLGYQAHKKIVDWMNFFLSNEMRLLGTHIAVKGLENLPEDRSVIIVSNHQSMMDIPPIIWLLRKHHVKFIAKKELSDWVPSISFNLKKGGSLLIDRKKGTETITQIGEYAKLLKAKGFSICIFPEGTRSRNGQLKPFKSGGLQALVDHSEDLPIVPFVVHGNYKVFHKSSFPLQIGQKITYEVLPTIYPKDIENKVAAEVVHQRIATALSSDN